MLLKKAKISTSESMMKCLNATFAKGNFPILEADKFMRVYRDSGNVYKDFGRMSGLVFKFGEIDWFALCAKKIYWYDNLESDDPNVWNAENWLESMRRDNYGCIKGD